MMIHAREDYNRIQDPAGLIPEDEPVFLIRGQDVVAPAALRMYANLAETRGVAAGLIQRVRDQADRMDTWQAERARKVPDLAA